jgi:hypothetical protein
VRTVSGEIVYDDLTRSERSFGLLMGLRGTIAGGQLGGDYSYRKLSGALWLAHSYGRIWSSWGIADGSTPNQTLYDLGADGGLLTVPVWNQLGTRFWSSGPEGRIDLWRPVFGYPFVIVGGPGELRGPVSEGGIGFAISDPAPGGIILWRLHLDWPFYSTYGDGSRSGWEWKRLAVRLQFDEPFVNRIIDYRYL